MCQVSLKNPGFLPCSPCPPLTTQTPSLGWVAGEIAAELGQPAQNAHPDGVHGTQQRPWAHHVHVALLVDEAVRLPLSHNYHRGAGKGPLVYFKGWGWHTMTEAFPMHCLIKRNGGVGYGKAAPRRAMVAEKEVIFLMPGKLMDSNNGSQNTNVLVSSEQSFWQEASEEKGIGRCRENGVKFPSSL